MCFEQSCAKLPCWNIWFATDNDGTGMLRQASAYMKRHLPEDVAKKMYQQYQDGKKAEADGKTEYSVEDADQAIINAKKEKEQAVRMTKRVRRRRRLEKKTSRTMRIIRTGCRRRQKGKPNPDCPAIKTECAPWNDGIRYVVFIGESS